MKLFITRGLPIIAKDIVGVGRIANKVFNTDQELINLIINNKMKQKMRSNLPKEYTWNNVQSRYLNIFKNV